jgi:hypothetical protein
MSEHYDNEPNPLPIWELTYVNNFCATGEDTIINTLDYKRINVCHANGSSYFGAIRYETGRVYYVPNDSLNEGLLYDFTLNAGDITNVLIMQPSEAASGEFFMVDVTVNNVDTIIVNGTQRRQIGFSGYSWIEGVGCTAGLFAESWINVSMYNLQLQCMSVANETIVSNGWPLAVATSGDCPLTLNIEEKTNVNHWNLSPNPASDVIRISSGLNETYQIEIFDASGRLVLKNYRTEEEIPVQVLENGLYHAEILNGENPAIIKFVVAH